MEIRNHNSIQPTEPTWVKISPSKWTVAIVNALYAIFSPTFSKFDCAQLITQGHAFQVSPNQWSAFLAAMTQFGLDWSRRYVEDTVPRQFEASLCTAYCLLNPPGGQVAQAVLDLLREYADLDLNQEARDVIVTAAMEKGRPFTVANHNYEDFTARLRVLMPTVNYVPQWTPLHGAAY